jgi:hypothetical protein
MTASTKLNVSIKSLQSAVTTALNAAATYSAAIDAIKVHAGRKNEANVRAMLLPCVAKHFAIGVAEGQRGATFDKDHDSYEAARKALQRLLSDVMGKKGNAKAEFVPLSRAQLALAKELGALSSEQRRAIWAKATELAKAAKTVEAA